MKTISIRTGIAAAALLFASLVTQAADFRRPVYKTPDSSAPLYASWSGFYVGLNGGYGFATSHWDVPAVSASPKGALAGGTVGYNLQTGTWLWGMEGDVEFSGMKGSADCGGGAPCETKNSWLATARGRLGYAGAINWLPYFTGGAAFGDIKASNSLLVSSASKTAVGWTLGAGVEYAMWSNWSVKLEYLYVDLGKFGCGTACGAAADNVSFKANVVRAGLNYRF